MSVPSDNSTSGLRAPYAVTWLATIGCALYGVLAEDSRWVWAAPLVFLGGAVIAAKLVAVLDRRAAEAAAAAEVEAAAARMRARRGEQPTVIHPPSLLVSPDHPVWREQAGVQQRPVDTEGEQGTR